MKATNDTYSLKLMVLAEESMEMHSHCGCMTGTSDIINDSASTVIKVLKLDAFVSKSHELFGMQILIEYTYLLQVASLYIPITSSFSYFPPRSHIRE